MTNRHPFVLELTETELEVLKLLASWRAPRPLVFPYDFLYEAKWPGNISMADVGEALTHVQGQVAALAWQKEVPETVTLHCGEDGWFYSIDGRPDEGTCGSFPLRGEAEDHARACGYVVDRQIHLESPLKEVVEAFKKS